MADPLRRTARLFHEQSVDCRRLGSPLYAGLLAHAATDVERGGPTADLVESHLEQPASGLLPGRLMAGVHAQVLTRQAPELALYYPSVGGTADPGENADLAWPVLRDLLVARADSLRPWLDRPPQTNEVGRGAALAGALCHLVAATDLPVRLVEVGASAGLNLRADRFHVTGAGSSYGDLASPVQLLDGWRGSPPPAAAPRVVDRVGGDLHPVDPTTTAGRLLLTAYVWADQVERLERLRGGLALAAAVPALVRAEPAVATVERIEPSPGSWTVLWHSVFRQYLTDADHDAMAAAIRAVGGRATVEAPFAYTYLEPASRSGEGDVEVVLTTWPGGRRRRLGVAAPHGIPTTWHGPARMEPDRVS